MDEVITEPEESELSDEELQDIVQELLTDKHPDVWGPHTIQFFGPKTHSVILSGEIDDRTASALCGQILELHRLDPKAPITLYINTPGGDVVHALAIYDCLLCVENPVITIVIGGAYSAGMLLAMAGDIRLATPNSMYFYHQPVMQVVGIDSIHSLESTTEFYRWCRQRVGNIIRERAGLAEDVWENEFSSSTSKYFDAQTAVELGVATDLLEYTVKPIMVLGEEEE